MNTLTVRIDKETHNKLKELSTSLDSSMTDILNRAIKKYYNDEFWREVNKSYSNLRKNKKLYEEDKNERLLWESTLSDNIKE